MPLSQQEAVDQRRRTVADALAAAAREPRAVGITPQVVLRATLRVQRAWRAALVCQSLRHCVLSDSPFSAQRRRRAQAAPLSAQPPPSAGQQSAAPSSFWGAGSGASPAGAFDVGSTWRSAAVARTPHTPATATATATATAARSVRGGESVQGAESVSVRTPMQGPPSIALRSGAGSESRRAAGHTPSVSTAHRMGL